MTELDVPELYRRHLSSGRAGLAQFTGGHLETDSAGARVHASGHEYLDCGGYGVFLLGHRHPVVTSAVIEQIGRNPMATRLLLEPTAAVAAQALAAVTPEGLDRIHFVNSGAEAVEAAIKFARAQGRKTLISAVNGYHGKTTGALSLTAREVYQQPFRPLLPDVLHVPYGDASAIAEVLAGQPNRACVVLEPIQGEGGVVLPPPGYLREVAQLCAEYGALFVLDEVQTGLGRLGTWWGADREDVVPDVLLVGKNLSGGVIPVAAAVTTDEIYAPFDKDPLLHTSTFAASPVAMAAAAATVSVIAEEGLVDRARELGDHLLLNLRSIVDREVPHLGLDIRGAGLLIGVEAPSAHIAGDLALELLSQRVLVNHSLNASTVLRLTPPAVLTEADLDWLFTAFVVALKAVGARHRGTAATLERTS
ncbi:aminotransferase class III-fold pyridoxal phosphate-dependent enzyme [Lentzea sp. BCCO 10_0856]|uniref:Aminotransferase class III-fold pyridoxal phosphate-dependent enzyme n=1 Tax=Lentzea miocenica TaxID=3095431 RepID=A0ABU4TEW0_9PSEU|nr:aminotransferase class III-fold pyridoxal phosphate-dependent enzyme [Lentzea sp. BCCO 10_0856]MDX8036739.1 aminotransferase class III-fold pyridoxal phosphate-dependent enzyme [Lentzea sp. BCCO 10_0856]